MIILIEEGHGRKTGEKGGRCTPGGPVARPEVDIRGIFTIFTIYPAKSVMNMGIAKALTKVTLTAALAATMAFEARSQSVMITFDDLATAGSWIAIPNGYAGLSWTNFGAIDGGGIINSALPNSGYYYGIVSSSNVAFNVGGGPADISSRTAFTLSSGYFTAAWNYGLMLEAQGYAGSSLMYDQTNIINTSGPQYITFDFAGVTSVHFLSWGGTEVGLGYGPNFALDNLTIIEAPEPSILALASVGGVFFIFSGILKCRMRRHSGSHLVSSRICRVNRQNWCG